MEQGGQDSACSVLHTSAQRGCVFLHSLCHSFPHFAFFGSVTSRAENPTTNETFSQCF